MLLLKITILPRLVLVLATGLFLTGCKDYLGAYKGRKADRERLHKAVRSNDGAVLCTIETNNNFVEFKSKELVFDRSNNPFPIGTYLSRKGPEIERSGRNIVYGQEAIVFYRYHPGTNVEYHESMIFHDKPSDRYLSRDDAMKVINKAL